MLLGIDQLLKFMPTPQEGEVTPLAGEGEAEGGEQFANLLNQMAEGKKGEALVVDQKKLIEGLLQQTDGEEEPQLIKAELLKKLSPEQKQQLAKLEATTAKLNLEGKLTADPGLSETAKKLPVLVDGEQLNPGGPVAKKVPNKYLMGQYQKGQEAFDSQLIKMTPKPDESLSPKQVETSLANKGNLTKAEMKLEGESPVVKQGLPDVALEQGGLNLTGAEQMDSDDSQNHLGAKGQTREIAQVTRLQNAQASQAPVFNMSELGKTSTQELIDKISQYFDQDQLQRTQKLDLVVKHEELGRFQLQVSKAAHGQDFVDLKIQTMTPEGQKFFQENQRDLLASLGRNGVQVNDLKMAHGADGLLSQQDDKGQSRSDSQGRSWSGQQHQQERGSQEQQDSARRRQLWQQYQENRAA